MAGNGLCKFRKNMMKIFIYTFLVLILVSCSNPQDMSSNQDEKVDKKYNWRLVTSWPKNYPGLGMAPERIADLVEEMSNGQMKITVFGAEEQVPALHLKKW